MSLLILIRRLAPGGPVFAECLVSAFLDGAVDRALKSGCRGPGIWPVELCVDAELATQFSSSWGKDGLWRDVRAGMFGVSEQGTHVAEFRRVCSRLSLADYGRRCRGRRLSGVTDL